jgi:hypothetical protein
VVSIFTGRLYTKKSAFFYIVNSCVSQDLYKKQRQYSSTGILMAAHFLLFERIGPNDYIYNYYFVLQRVNGAKSSLGVVLKSVLMSYCFAIRYNFSRMSFT